MKKQIGLLLLGLIASYSAQASYLVRVNGNFQPTDHIYAGDIIQSTTNNVSYRTSGELVLTVDKTAVSNTLDFIQQLGAKTTFYIEKDAQHELIVIDGGDQDLLYLHDALAKADDVISVAISPVTHAVAQ